MPTLTNLIATHCDMETRDADWLVLLTGDWQIVADAAFADLVLWLPRREGGYIAATLCRPTTGATIYYDDVVGTLSTPVQTEQFDRVRNMGVIQRNHEPQWYGAYSVREEIIPVTRRGRVIAIMTRQTNLGAARTPSRLELNYVEIADELVEMIARGEYPSPNAPTGPRRGSPRVGDGLIRLDAEGKVMYASPNALSVFHRFGVIGDIVGLMLVEVITDQLVGEDPVDESLPVVAMGRAPWRTDVENRGVIIALRAVPLTDGGIRRGALILCRDISDLRRRERELMTKDATIREIHHRVKNNLQTVAALLRLQARRIKEPGAKEALEEAMRRVSTIASVHDMLSQNLDETVDFDEVFGRSMRLAADVAAADVSVHTVRVGSFGQVGADDATALALVLTELVTNAVEHGLAPKGGGTVWVKAEREDADLTVTVADDGVGLGESGTPGSDGLGTQIIRTFVTGQLHGSIDWVPRKGGGTEVIIQVRLR